MPAVSSIKPARWTVMIVPHGSDATREVVVSRRALRVARRVATSLFMFVGVGALSTAAMAARHPVPAANQVTGASPATVDSLRRAIASIADREARIRVLAGLEPLDSVAHDTVGMTRDVSQLLRRATTLASSFDEVADSLEEHTERLASLPSIMPTAGWLTSQFSSGRRHPVLHISRPHEGIDLAAPMGTPIVAPASGVIRRAARENGYGLVMEIDHGNGIVTKFAHCSRLIAREGQRVTRGQTVAAVGNTGLSTGPHLHYEIHVNGRVVDPLKYVLPSAAIPD
jgi:murein DD-endopeptidase MepM/ murein hydrolase activator NlpD